MGRHDPGAGIMERAKVLVGVAPPPRRKGGRFMHENLPGVSGAPPRSSRPRRTPATPPGPWACSLTIDIVKRISRIEGLGVVAPDGHGSRRRDPSCGGGNGAVPAPDRCPVDAHVPDVLIRNARVYTVDGPRAGRRLIPIRGDRIAWVGSDEEAVSRAGGDVEAIDAERSRPARLHRRAQPRADRLEPTGGGLAGAATLDELRARVRAHADAHPEQTWIEEADGTTRPVPGGRLPTRWDLDGLTPGVAFLVLSYDAHNVWLNAEAMAIFGIGRDTDAVAVRACAEGPQERRAHRVRDRLRGDGDQQGR